MVPMATQPDPSSTSRPTPTRGGPVVLSRSLKLFLASRSPRRRELMTEAGYTFDFDHPGIEDSELPPGQVNPGQWVASLAYLKARAGVERAREIGKTPDVVIGADTACVMDGQLIGTPIDADEAKEMIRAFAGREHDVVSGIALVSALTGKRMMGSNRARVRVGTLSDSQIDEYVRSGGWAGKAGAYNLSERLGDGWPIKYDGDPATIMGLPMGLLRSMLDEFVTMGGAR